MIKRPLVYLLLAFIIGANLEKMELVNERQLVLIVILLLVLIMVLLFFKFYLNEKDWLLVVAPIFLLLGSVLTGNELKMSSMDACFVGKTKGSVTGTVERITLQGEYEVLSLKNSSVELVENREQFDKMNFIVYLKSVNDFKIGNVVEVSGTIGKFQRASNPGQFDEFLYYKSQGIDYKIYEADSRCVDSKEIWLLNQLQGVKNKLIENYSILLNEQEAGIVDAMLLGEKSYLDGEIKELYKQNGISHILAISGLHVSLVGMYLFRFFKKLRLGITVSVLMANVSIYLYGLFTNFGVSTKRAVFMLILSLSAILLGRTYDMLSAASLSALVILINSPLELFNCGFLLSYGAILGIAIFVPIFKGFENDSDSQNSKEIEKNDTFKLKSYIKEGICISFCVNLVTFPILLYYFYEVSTYSIVLNLFILPFMPFLILFAAAGGAVGISSYAAGRFLIGISHYILIFYNFICNVFNKLPVSVLSVRKPEIITIFLYYGILILFLILSRKFKSIKICYLLILLFILFIPNKNFLLEITFLDVGQGDAIFIRTPENTTYFVDGGSSSVSKVGKYRLLPYMKASGINIVDYIFITHTDSDHISGLMELIGESGVEFQIKNIVMPNIVAKDDTYYEIVENAKEKNINVSYIKKGDKLIDGAVEFFCLHPDSQKEEKNKNASSTVLIVKYDDVEILLTGDLEGEVEEELQKQNLLTDCDILKVAHHGSKNSTNDYFLRMVKPEIAVISCGKENSYGHPHPELLQRLKEIGCQILRTSEDGAITIQTDGKTYKIKTFLKNNEISLDY